jgi:hypothetical protein
MELPVEGVQYITGKFRWQRTHAAAEKLPQHDVLAELIFSVVDAETAQYASL